MKRNLPNISKNLPKVQCVASESLVVFLESVANVFLPKQQVLEISFRNDSIIFGSVSGTWNKSKFVGIA